MVRGVSTRKIVRGATAGCAAGLAGGAAMSVFSTAWRRAFPASAGEPPAGGSLHLPYEASQQEWDSTEAAAQATSRSLLRHELKPKERAKAAMAVHFAVSAAAGALYGAAVEVIPAAAAGDGSAFGAAMWLLAQEVAMPLMGWSRPLSRYSAAMQANSFGEHVAYGVATEWLRRRLRRSR